MRYLNASGINIEADGQNAVFADEDEIADYAREAMHLLNGMGIINGVGNNAVDPESGATRAQTAAMLHRFIEAIER
jgi:hypothetical protein